MSVLTAYLTRNIQLFIQVCKVATVTWQYSQVVLIILTRGLQDLTISLLIQKPVSAIGKFGPWSLFVFLRCEDVWKPRYALAACAFLLGVLAQDTCLRLQVSAS